MKVILLSDPQTFLERTVAFRSDEPYLTNVMGSVATSVSTGLRTYDQSFWWLIEDSSGATRAMMMRTAPHKLVLSPMPDEVIEAAADAVLAHDPEVPGVTGSKTLVERFVAAFAQGSSRRFDPVVERCLWVYKLGELTSAAAVPASSRVADDADFELLRRWWWAFAEETGVERYGLEEGLRGALAHGRIALWSLDERPACAVGTSPVVDVPSGSIVRVGPVYTPPEDRRRGYAGQLTGVVSSRLVDAGHGVMLFTDSANATSNGVYTRLGYEKIDEVVECILEPSDAQHHAT
jgi:predicted GNAT family acetyltransferase